MRTNRLLRVQEGLTAGERGRIALRDWKEDRPPDPSLLRGLGEARMPDFYELAQLVSGTHRGLGMRVLLGLTEVEGLEREIRQAALLRGWSLEIESAWDYVAWHTREEITETEERERLEEMREEWLPFVEAVDSLEAADDAPPRRTLTKRLRQAMRDGTVLCRRASGQAEVQLGSLAAWNRDVLRVPAERGREVEVRPDGEAERVQQAREARVKAIDSLARLRMESARCGKRMASLGARVAQHALEMATVAAVVEECSGAFAGDDILHPLVREMLDDVLERTEALMTALQLDAVEPDDELVERMRALVDAWGGQ